MCSRSVRNFDSRQRANPANRCRLLTGLLLVAATELAFAGGSFSAWLDQLHDTAVRAGIGAGTVRQVLADVTADPKVIEYDRRQPEKILSLDAYLARTISGRKVARGRQMLIEHQVLLQRLYVRYGVEPEILIALWALETGFGQTLGKMDTIRSLATLSYDQRRRDYFTGELLDALRVIDTGLLRHSDMRGSWAGAMGQFQFMPSVVKNYAVDDDGDGRIDIFTPSSDAFASAANYLQRIGWQRGLRWGREVGSGYAGQAPLVAPDGSAGRRFIVSDNFARLLIWNRSNKYAIAVGLLSDRLARR